MNSELLYFTNEPGEAHMLYLQDALDAACISSSLMTLNDKIQSIYVAPRNADKARALREIAFRRCDTDLRKVN